MSESEELKESKKHKKDKKSKKSKKSLKNVDLQDFENEYTNQLRNEYLSKQSNEDDTLAIPENDRLSVGWDIRDYSMKVQGQKPCSSYDKCILHQSTGLCKPGTITAIVGPSGAGKTSLIRILAQKIDKKHYDGEVLINGKECHPAYYQKVSGFVAQEDIIMGTSKAGEALMFAANLKLPSLDEAQKQEIVDNLLKNIGLYHVKDSLVGYYGTAAINSTIKGRLSGGERKRLSICIELVNNPKILFLDEPTSGLDSYAALVVIENLRKLAYMGRTIICSIHQPSSEIAKLFDNLIVLSDGKTVYSGPTDKAIGYFSDLGYVCPKYYNPIEFIINVVQEFPNEVVENDSEDDLEKDKDDKGARLEEIYQKYQKSKYNNYLKNEVETLVSDPKELPEISKGYSHSNLGQVRLLLGRMFTNIIREPRLFRVRLSMGVFTAILAGLIWLRIPLTFTGGTDRIAAAYFLVSSVMFSASSGPITLFAVERAVFYREHNGGMYSAGAFYISKLISEMPVNILAPVLSATIGWWLMGLHDDGVKYLIFVVFLISLTLVAHGLGMMLASAFDDPTVGLRVQMLVMLPLMLFSGFFLNNANIPVYFIWLQYLSPIKYAFSGAVITVLQGLALNCTSSELIDISVPIQPNITNITQVPPGYPGNITEYLAEINKTIYYNTTFCPVTSGDTLLTQLDVDTNFLWFNFLILMAMFVATNLVAFLSIRFCKRVK